MSGPTAQIALGDPEADRIDTGTERLIARVEGAIGWLTFNNAERRNAISIDMWAGMSVALKAFEEDPRVRVVVLLGAGDKAFVSGADISQFEEQRASAEAEANFRQISGAAQAKLSGLAKPSVAMIRGFCIGGGLAVALSCDLRIAAEGSQFGIPAARLGLGYGYEGLAKLVDIVGPAYAKEIMFTARRLQSDEALRMGLVNRIVPGDQLEPTVRELADMMGANAPLTVRAAKMAVDEAVKDPAHRDLAAVTAAVAACFASEDFIEGRRAFMEKRTPVFKGR
ncbi:MAG: enoyl-CoA hydratase [Phenylobacterium sp.]|uniref:enoyl-CoA hydratase n=1 Tax=Phenylobacterium sp. TaxID=1871053 RepID=UPI002732CC2E|nr:enoyl-CoA hydratase [Phenylobacterium sp.]MDP3173826.1 enoyl-CoA hydratase [Phenylobacterium sp.]